MPLKERLPSTLRSLTQELYGELLLRYYNSSYTISVDGVDAAFSMDEIQDLRQLQRQRKEERIIADILSHLESGDVFFDVGANKGLYSCIVGRSSSDIDVVAFEPHPEFLSKLYSNIELNNIDVSVVDCALSDADSELSIDNMQLNHSKVGGAVTVNTMRGDDAIVEYDLPEPDIMKIDIEGAELRAIDGFEDSLRSGNPRLLYIEVHPDMLPEFGDTVADLNDRLDSYGYNWEYIHNRDSQEYIRAVRT